MFCVFAEERGNSLKFCHVLMGSARLPASLYPYHHQYERHALLQHHSNPAEIAGIDRLVPVSWCSFTRMSKLYFSTEEACSQQCNMSESIKRQLLQI